MYVKVSKKSKQVKISLLQAMEALGLREVKAPTLLINKRLIDGGKVIYVRCTYY
jgi:hypothetical protein